MMGCDTLHNILHIFDEFVDKFEADLDLKDPSTPQLRMHLHALRRKVRNHPQFGH